MRPRLLIDAYLGDAGCARNYSSYLREGVDRVIRAKQEAPDCAPSEFASIVISGSAASLLEPPEWTEPLARFVREAVLGDTPVLGVCFGHQLIAHSLFGHGAVQRCERPEFGWIQIDVDEGDSVVGCLAPRIECFVSHRDEVVCPQPGMRVLAHSDDCAVHAMAIADHPTWGVQFHPEMGLSEATALVHSRCATEELVAEKLSGARDTSGLVEGLMRAFVSVERPH